MPELSPMIKLDNLLRQVSWAAQDADWEVASEQLAAAWGWLQVCIQTDAATPVEGTEDNEIPERPGIYDPHPFFSKLGQHAEFLDAHPASLDAPLWDNT